MHQQPRFLAPYQPLGPPQPDCGGTAGLLQLGVQEGVGPPTIDGGVYRGEEHRQALAQVLVQRLLPGGVIVRLWRLHPLPRVGRSRSYRDLGKYTAMGRHAVPIH